MKKRTWRWVSRNLQSTLVSIWQKAERPLLYGKTWADAGGEASVCASEFKRLFGFVPEPGKCLKVEFSAKVDAAKRKG